MLVGFARYSRDQSFTVLRRNRIFVLVMAVGSIVGSFVGGQLLGIVPGSVLLPLLAGILLISGVKVWCAGRQNRSQSEENPIQMPDSKVFLIQDDRGN